MMPSSSAEIPQGWSPEQYHQHVMYTLAQHYHQHYQAQLAATVAAMAQPPSSVIPSSGLSSVSDPVSHLPAAPSVMPMFKGPPVVIPDSDSSRGSPFLGPQTPTLVAQAPPGVDPSTIFREKLCSRCISMTAKGQVITTDPSGTLTTVTELVDLMISVETGTDFGRTYVRNLTNYPGPLSSSVKTDVIRQYLENIAPSGPLRNYLTANLTKPLEWAQGGPALFLPFLQQADPGEPVVPWHPEAPVESPEGRFKAFESVQALLLQGNRSAAIAASMEGNQWMLALLIAAMCDKDSYLSVVSTFIQQNICATSPLATILLQFNDMKADTSKLSAWKEHVQILLVNYVKAATTLPAIVAWGDALQQASFADEAHFCYLLAQKANPKEYSGKFVLCGGLYRRDLWRSALINERSLFQTEILEFTAVSTAPQNRDAKGPIRTSFQPFKVALALLCMELGLLDKATALLEAIGKALPSPSSRKEEQPIVNLPQFVEALKVRVKRLGKQETKSKSWIPWPSRGGSSTTTAQEKGIPNKPSTLPMKATPKAAPQTAPQGSSRSGWGLWPFGGSGGTQKDETKKDQAKKVILPDDDEKPVFDQKTGKWVFANSQMSAEELEQERRAKAGPPKIPMMVSSPAAPTVPLGAPQPLNPSNNTSFSNGVGGPPAMPTPMGGPLMPTPRGSISDLTTKYVDVFNS